jgi:hypothetical protein
MTGAAISRPGHPTAFTALPPGERENHQDDQAERDTHCTDIQPQAGHTDRTAVRQVVHGDAQDHQDGAKHHRRGARDRQDDDKSHPSAGSGTSSHCSTIASPLPPRKPYGQV